MMRLTNSSPEHGTNLKDPAITQKVQELRKTDNSTNWLYLVRAYLIILVAITGAIVFHRWQLSAGISILWNIPIVLLAILVVGASQHQLAGATHEATHHILFRNRRLNELVSDWLCMFPLFSSTYIFRLHHLAHHQFINDPERDPDFSQLRLSGHWLKFPVTQAQFIWKLFAQCWIVPLVRYILVRARFNSLGGVSNPYNHEEKPSSPWPMRIALIHFACVLGYTGYLTLFNSFWPLLLLPSVSLSITTILLLRIPNEDYPVTRLVPVISPRTAMISRVWYVTILFALLGWIQYGTGVWAIAYFLILWVVPIFTSFAFFMILRQLVQHGNGDRGWLTNTRTFLVNPFIRYAVFPFGMDYHLPHHMFASVPHYRLPQLHQFLLNYPEYAEHGITVEGYFHSTHKSGEKRNPTVVEVLGPEYAQHSEEIFIDHTVLEQDKLDNNPRRSA